MVIMKSLARWGLFGKSGGKAKPSFGAMLLGDVLALVGIDTGLPSVVNLAEYYIDVVWSALFGESDAMPPDFPAKLYAAVETVLHNRGGFYDEGKPNFYCKRSGCSSNLLTWTVQVHTVATADPNKLDAMEASIEEALTKAGYDCNVRILKRPLRIEIDKPESPTVRLTDYWRSVGTLPQNELWCAPGVTASDKGLVLFARQMTGERYSAFVSGRSGAGKTQLAMSLILTMAYTNSPAHLAMVIIDPKVVDTTAFAALPHLALPIVTDDRDCQTILDQLAAEMDDRKRRLERGDRSFLDQRIFVYLDEAADLLSVVADKERALTAWQRLCQKGRAYGFVLVGGTQRAYAVDKRFYANLNDRYALAANDASDGFAATGIAGVQVHKLPGRGACEVYPDGTRIQGFFVADAESKTYEAEIRQLLTDIRNRWGGVAPCWVPEVAEETAQTDFLDYLTESGITGIHAIRKAHKDVYGVGIGTNKAHEIQAQLGLE